MKKFNYSFGLIMLALAGCGSNNEESADTVLTVDFLPSVEAGLDQNVTERSTVNLAGSASDNEGNVTFSWEQVSGETVDLNDADTLTPQFRAPSTREDETIVFRLTVTDSAGQSVADDVTIVVNDRRSSSQGIDDNSDERRDNANNNRNNNTIVIDDREVRTFDGSNNNTDNPLWGASFIHLERWGEVDYEDGISSLAGASRPSARVVSNNVHHQDLGVTIVNEFGTTDFLWQWGQFLDHDIGVTDGAEEAADITVPEGDEYFDPNSTGEARIFFTRALFDHSTGTDVDNPREQENELTAWIDGSMVYGSDDVRALALRVSADSPYLATSDGNLLPFNTSGQTNANAFGVPAEQLFLAGDIRANEQLGLTTMHTLWVREHNRIAAILEQQSPAASGEAIFQTARRLVIAKIQIITFEEYLPALLGDDAISNYRGYDDDVNPGMFNEFSVAAYRYGHSLVNNVLLRLDENGDTIQDGNVDLRDAFFTAPSVLTDENSIDPILRGLASQASQKLDVKVSFELRNFLFGAPGAGGLDLVSLNIQRGRDHGVPSYNDMREIFGLERRANFGELTSDVELQLALENTFDSVDDVDLFTGGLAEDPLVELGSQMGELFRAMNIEQFEAFRDADRFWYRRYLSDEELAFVEDTTLAEVIRDNTNITNEIQDNVFFLSGN
ncbi:peroxidase family protein [Glaciecola petra]|uniref:Peroxidase family protein n=1 Tax=Glaciecola petra TaxID=3075602 RepID=A0ABU2ZQB5_9ALTE|nr:peroxidase family protein [Aestuariibacter sp. P117]MDT0594813.1 peroxidase family protein [Aestuariibacter sp. P117]